MGKTKKASKIAVPLPPPPATEATTDYETGASGSSSTEVHSPSEFDSGQPVISTAKASRKRPGTAYKNADLTIPPGRVVKKLRDGKYAKVIHKAAGVYMAAVLEYLVAEMVEISEEQATLKKKKRITPKHIFDGIAHDLDMKVVLKHVIIPGGGVTPGVHPSLVQKTRKQQKQPEPNRKLSFSPGESSEEE